MTQVRIRATRTVVNTLKRVPSVEVSSVKECDLVTDEGADLLDVIIGVNPRPVGAPDPGEAEEAFDAYSEKIPTIAAEAMEAGRSKYGDSWLDVEPEYAWRRTEEELYELRQATEHDRDVREALKEIADMENFAKMFVALELAGEGR